MTVSWRKSTMAVALAVVLAIGLCPGLAFAQGVTASADTAQKANTLQTQATKTVYVLTKLVENGKSTSEFESTGQITNSSVKKTVKFSYNSKGLLAKSVFSAVNKTTGQKSSSQNATIQWKYNKKNQLNKIVRANGTVKLTLDSKGKMKKSKSDFGYTGTFSYKSGKVVALKEVGNGTTANKKFTYKNGRIAKMKSNIKGSGIPSFMADWRTDSFAYDAKGNLVGRGGAPGNTKNTYNSKGLLTKRYSSTYKETSSSGSSTTIAYTYKPIKVSSKLASKIEAQQWALLNDNFNFALGNGFGYGYLNATNNFYN